MPLQPLDIPPGFFTEESEYGAGPRWVDGDKVRFRLNRPEPIGGWTSHHGSTLDGVARDIHGWSDLSGNEMLSIGTNRRLYHLADGTLTDITPARETGTLGTDPFTTTSGVDTVSVADTSHGLSVGDIIIFSGSTTVNGVDMDGEWTVDTVTDANTYVVDSGQTASGSGAGGGASVAYTYLLPVGGERNSSGGLGYGVGPYNHARDGGGWNKPATAATGIVRLGTWSLDHWGEDLIACRKGYAIYQWDTSVGAGTRAAVLSNAPTANFALVSDNDRHLIAFGAGGDPMKIQWSDQEDNTTWTAAATNTAGDVQLQVGSAIIGAIKTQNEILVWTDEALYGMRFVGPPWTFAIRLISKDAGLAGPHAAAVHGSNVYWIDADGTFHVFNGGGVAPLLCPVLEKFRDTYDYLQGDQVFAFDNNEFHEITWLYCSTSSSSSNDRYVTYNYLINQWYYGTLDRSVWMSARTFYDVSPIAVGSNGDVGTIYEHEIGTDDGSSAMNAWIKTGFFEIGNGDQFGHISGIVPDFENITGTVTTTWYGKRYPQGTLITKGPYDLTSSTKKYNFRLRSRQFAFRVESNAVGAEWRMGQWRVNMRGEGSR